MAQDASLSAAAIAQAKNQFPYVIEGLGGRFVAGCTAGPMAYAMYRAALDEFFGEQLVLKHQGVVVAERC